MYPFLLLWNLQENTYARPGMDEGIEDRKRAAGLCFVKEAGHPDADMLQRQNALWRQSASSQ